MKYDYRLLKHPFKFGDDSKDLKQIADYLLDKKWHKLDKCPAKKKQCEELLKEFQEIYGQVKAQKNSKATKGNKTERFNYYIDFAKQSDSDLFSRLKYKGRDHV